MKLKRVFSSMMALGLMVTIAACGSSTDSTKAPADGAAKEDAKNAEGEALEAGDESQDIADFDKQTSDDTLVIGVEEINGDFVGGWTNNKTDVKARRLMGIEGNNGYSTSGLIT